MAAPNLYSYDCRQPDPEIWSGGSTTSLFSITSGSEYSETKFYGATGLVSVSGLSILESLTKDYVGDGLISSSSTGVEQVVYAPSIVGQNINIFGSANYSFTSPEIGQEISLDYSGFIVEKITHNYNKNSTETFTSSDDGLISSGVTESDDYGLLTTPLLEHIDYGSTEILSTTTALSGGLILSNSATYKHVIVETFVTTTTLLSSQAVERLTYIPPINQRLYQSSFSSTELTFDNNELTFDSTEEVANIKLTGLAAYQIVYNTPEQTIDITSSVSSIESRGHSYNDSSVGSFVSEDHGTIISAATSSSDYGSISLSASQGDEDFGFVFDTNSSILPFGSLTLSGSAFVKAPDNIRTYNTGASYRVTYNPPENTSSLFTFGEKSESITYDYSIDSIENVETESFGLVTSSPTEIEDSGSLVGIVTELLDYEGIDIVATNYPFGSLNINGSAITQYTNVNFYDYPVTSIVRVSYSPDNTTGTLFTFGEKLESVTYDYSEESVTTYSTENFGLITSVANEFDDHGNIYDIVTGVEEYGGIEIVTGSTPFGSIAINGSAITQYTNVNFYDYPVTSIVRISYSPDNTTGTLFGFGQKVESVTYDYNNDSILYVSDSDYGLITGTITSSEDYQLISEIASPSDDFGFVVGPSINNILYPFGSLYVSGQSTEKNTEVYVSSSVGIQFSISGQSTNIQFITKPSENTVLCNISGSAGIAPVSYVEVGSGSLFEIGEKSESFTYDYNDLSVNTLELENNGLITSSPTEITDYGLISSVVTGEDSYGEIDLTSTTVPFGTVYITGNANVTYYNANFYDYPVTSIVRVSYSPDNTTGTLFTFGEKLESVTYDYSEESILSFVSDDYELVSGSPTITDDYGQVNEVYGEQVDNGLDTGLGVSQTINPFGTLTISGTSGSGLRTYGEENTVLFTITGSLAAPNIDYTPSISGIGTVFVSGSAEYAFTNQDLATQVPTIVLSETLVESRTHSYNESSISPELLLNYGLISGLTTESDDDYGSVSGSNGETTEFGFITAGIQSSQPFGTITISGTTLIYPEVDYTPSPDGSGTIAVIGSATYSETNAFGVGRRRGGNINLCGDATYSETDVYIGIGTVYINQTLIESESDSYVGFGTIFVSDTAIEADQESYVGVAGTLTLSGTAVESFTAETPDNTSLFVITNTPLVHPFVDYTPHYGIEKNVGIGTTGIQISGTVNDAANRFARGEGTIFIVNGFSPQESYPWLPGAGVGRSWSYTRQTYIGLGTAYFGGDSRNYSTVYPRNALRIDGSSGIGTIRINDDKELTLYRATLPYNARGTIVLSGIGRESFTETTFIGSGTLTLSGIASTREIAVYQGYVTGGSIFISQQTQPIIERNTESYLGLGTIFVSDSSVLVEVDSYRGLGTLFTISGASEAYSAQTPEQTVDITISGSAQESFIAQTPEQTVSYQFYGAATDEKITKDYEGFGSTIISGSATVKFEAQLTGTGGFRFVKYSSDQTYDTCDSTIITSDHLYSADVRFVANPPENIILYNFYGSGSTSEIKVYTYSGFGSVGISGSHIIKKTKSIVGIGTLNLQSTSIKKEVDSYIGSGFITTLSGSAESKVSSIPKSTILFSISGISSTRRINVKTYSGIGTGYLSGSASTKVLARFPYSGLGTISLSGTLVYPDVKYIPAPKGSGTINISGSGLEKIGHKYIPISQNLFAFSGAFESFTESTYVGVGTIYVLSTSASTINNPYQIPRVYVCIV